MVIVAMNLIRESTQRLLCPYTTSQYEVFAFHSSLQSRDQKHDHVFGLNQDFLRQRLITHLMEFVPIMDVPFLTERKTGNDRLRRIHESVFQEQMHGICPRFGNSPQSH